MLREFIYSFAKLAAPRYKKLIWVDPKTGKVWKIDPNTNTRVEIKEAK